MNNIESLLQSLNPAQRDAVDTLNGPLLILAGAGSGKTRVLTFRIANLIARGMALPEQILAVTFTNKAAREMEERTLHLLRQMGVIVPDRLWISTFHSICVRILRAHADLLEYKPFFGIYDSSDQLGMIKKVLTALNIDDKMYPAKAFQSRINSCKMLGLAPDAVASQSGARQVVLDEMSLSIYRRYEDDMKKSNNMDFGDLLMKTYQLFLDYPSITEFYQTKFKYIMIDEYQDTNRIQYKLIAALAEGHHNLCVVGDEDQSIYSWRGADIANILSFEKDFSDCKVVKLEENYRSTKTIVTAASQLIKNNTQRKDKTLFTSKAIGEKIWIQEEPNEYDEARFVVRQIQSLLKESEHTYRDCAVFYRTNAQSRVLEEQLRTAAVPYKIVGGLKFYERLEIKDILAYMKLTLNPADDIALKRIINTPARGIGKTTLTRIEEIGHQRHISMLEATRWAAEQREFNAGTCRKLAGFLNLIEDLTAQNQGLSPSETYHLILDKTAYVNRLKDEATPEARARIENLEEFDNAIVQFEKERADDVTLQSFLEEMALVSDVDSLQDSDNSVTLMTLHISKGLEFPFVFVVGLEEGLFPSGRSTEGLDPTAIEEERRLAYVGMTRARERLFLTYCRTRRMWGSETFNPPSRFLKEIPEEHVTFNTGIQRPQFLDRYDKYAGAATHSERNSQRTSFDAVPAYEDFGDPDFDASPGSAQDLAKGMRVRHPTYGVGSIFEAEGSGDNQKVSVVFGDHSVKKFVVKYARLQRV